MSTLIQLLLLITSTVALTAAMPSPSARRSHHIKVDPFVALAQTLRQEEELEAQQRQQQHQYSTEADYEEREEPAEEDPIGLWQFQRQMGRAMLPLFNRQQRNWAVEEDDYGVPIMTQEEEYEGPLYPEEPVYSYFPKTGVNDDEGEQQQQEEEEVEADEEKRLLMDTLAEYMYLAGNNEQNAVKRSGIKEENQKDGQKEVSMGSQQKNMSRSKIQQLDQQEEQNSTNSTKSAAIVTPEDELIQELDTLKKKN